VAAVGAFALASPRGLSGLQLGSLLLGIWLIISPPILDHKRPIAHAMYWSNGFSGGVLIALAAAGLGFAVLAGPPADRPRSAGPEGRARTRAAQPPLRRPLTPAADHSSGARHEPQPSSPEPA
jgi:hypothetical protein